MTDKRSTAEEVAHNALLKYNGRTFDRERVAIDYLEKVVAKALEDYRNEGIDMAKKVAFNHKCRYELHYGTTMCGCSTRIANDIEDLKRGGR